MRLGTAFAHGELFSEKNALSVGDERARIVDEPKRTLAAQLGLVLSQLVDYLAQHSQLICCSLSWW